MIDHDTIEYACTHCGTKNRIPAGRVGEQPVCGECKQGVFPEAPVDVTDASWTSEVEQSPLPVLVDFWAPWCGPCRFMGPVLKDVAKERAGRLKVVKLDVDENPELAGRFNIRGIPTMLLLRGGKPVAQFVGAMPKQSLDQQLEARLSVS